ncbi:MAG: hypothetical protein ACYCZE_12545 [Thiobacillus sp.]
MVRTLGQPFIVPGGSVTRKASGTAMACRLDLMHAMERSIAKVRRA